MVSSGLLQMKCLSNDSFHSISVLLGDMDSMITTSRALLQVLRVKALLTFTRPLKWVKVALGEDFSQVETDALVYDL